MYIPFNELPLHSKVWIYQSNRKFSDVEIAEIEESLIHFIENWAAHGTSLAASFLTKYNRFIILAVDQEVQQATGCSIRCFCSVYSRIRTKVYCRFIRQNECYL